MQQNLYCMEERKPKWHERLAVYKNAIDRLTEVINLGKQHTLNEFERDSLVKRFEFSYEMAWKLMMSYEKENDITEVLGSKDVIRQAFKLSLINNGEAWLEMVDTRNRTSHLYDEEMVADVIDEIVYTYYPLLLGLRDAMVQIANNG